jgi:dynein heavy chain, axonemal
VQKIQDECKKILDQAMPQFNAAMKSLDTLKAGDISEIKMYQTPHVDIKMVFDAVCLLQGVKQDWKTAQQLMNNPGAFVSGLKSYDKDNIKDSILKKLKKFTNNERFDPELIKGKSVAAMSVAMWVKAMDVYSDVLKIVTPLKIKLAAAEKDAAKATVILNKKRAEL